MYLTKKNTSKSVFQKEDFSNLRYISAADAKKLQDTKSPGELPVS